MPARLRVWDGKEWKDWKGIRPTTVWIRSKDAPEPYDYMEEGDAVVEEDRP